jgi:hypothetical protein
MLQHAWTSRIQAFLSLPRSFPAPHLPASNLPSRLELTTRAVPEEGIYIQIAGRSPGFPRALTDTGD